MRWEPHRHVGNSIPRQRNRSCKGLEAGLCRACSRGSKEVGGVIGEIVRGTLVLDEGRRGWDTSCRIMQARVGSLDVTLSEAGAPIGLAGRLSCGISQLGPQKPGPPISAPIIQLAHFLSISGLQMAIQRPRRQKH